jgi:hypothetical protein
MLDQSLGKSLRRHGEYLRCAAVESFSCPVELGARIASWRIHDDQIQVQAAQAWMARHELDGGPVLHVGVEQNERPVHWKEHQGRKTYRRFGKADQSLDIRPEVTTIMGAIGSTLAHHIHASAQLRSDSGEIAAPNVASPGRDPAVPQPL